MNIFLSQKYGRKTQAIGKCFYQYCWKEFLGLKAGEKVNKCQWWSRSYRESLEDQKASGKIVSKGDKVFISLQTELWRTQNVFSSESNLLFPPPFSLSLSLSLSLCLIE